MKILLLGATGLLGHNLMLELVQQKHDVTVLVRKRESLHILPTGVNVIIGTPLDAQTLLQASRHIDAIVNCVGVTDMSLLHYSQYLAVNRDLCHLLVDALLQNDVKTLVHISTTNTIGNGTATQPATESAPISTPFSRSLYAKSKLEGESIILTAAHNRPDCHIVVLNPGYMIGPYDVKPSSGRMLDLAYRRRFMAVPSGGKCFVHVADVARAASAALTLGKSGSHYLVINSHDGTLSLRELYALQADTLGYRQHILTLPSPIVRLAGLVGDLLRTLGIRTALSSVGVAQLIASEHYDNSRALTELNLSETPISQAIKDYFQWKENASH